MPNLLTAPKPRAFIGSSGAAAKYAEEIKHLLSTDFEVRAWTDPDTFRPSTSTIDAILHSLQRSDFGIFVLDADDLLESKNRLVLSTRDNVLFEAGLYFGSRGASACFLFVPDISDLHIASDLAGLTQLRFKDGDLDSLAAKCDELRRFCVGDWRTPESIALTGKWTQTWEVSDSTNYAQRNPSDAYVAIFGRRWVAHHSVGKDIYTVEGDIRDRLITGRWFGPTEHHYHGVMQLALSPRLDKAEGIWSGSRSDGSIATGRWIWKPV
jgi:Predicted nucleotide-binding protein containing TIR-like domain